MAFEKNAPKAARPLFYVGHHIGKVHRMSYRVRKTEHDGAKNGGGYWGKRAEAKKYSDRVRRKVAQKEIQQNVFESEVSKYEKAVQDQDT